MQLGLAHLLEQGLAAQVEESRAFNASARAAAAARIPPDLSTAEGLDAARSGLSSRPPHPRAVELVARAGGHEVPVRVVAPDGRDARGVYLQMHGGGFYMDSASRSDALNVRLADAVGITVVSVVYRLAPEHPWPAAPDDCETAACWLVDEADRLFGTDQLLLGGASAGANLAAVTLLRLRDRGRVERFAGAVLQFGAFDLSGRSPAGRAYADEWFVDAYAGQVSDRSIPDVSPLYGDLRGLPPSLLVVGALDLLLEDSLAMAARLSAAGCEVDLRVYPESVHGFTSFPTAIAEAARCGIESFLADCLDGR